MREISRISWPIAVSLLSYSTMTLVDTLFVSRLGAGPLAGVGVGGTAAFLLLCFSFGLLRAVKTLVSQSVGAARDTDPRAYLGAGIVLSLGLSLVSVALGFLLAGLLPSITATAASGAAAREYLGIRLLGVPFVLPFVALREARYGEGDSRSPMVASIAANALNVALDWLLIFGAGLGVAGAAWASVAGAAAQLAVLALVQWRHGFGLSVFGLRELRAIWRLGLPTGLQFAVEMSSFSLMTALVAGFGEIDMAAHQVVLQVCHFSFLPALAVAEAVSVLAGQAVGADRDALVTRVARRGALLAAGYMGLCGLAFVLAGRWILAPFAVEGGLAVTALGLLRIAAIFQVFDAFYMVSSGALRGTGDVRFSAWAGIALAWLVTPPLTWVLGGLLGWGALGAWIGFCVEIVAGALLFFWRLERGGWRAAARRCRTALAASAPAPSPTPGEPATGVPVGDPARVT